jgi:hypothetical protein
VPARPLIYRRDITIGVLIFTVSITLFFVFVATVMFSMETRAVPAAVQPTRVATSVPYITARPHMHPTYVAYFGWHGVTAFKLLRQNAEITFSMSKHGPEVKSINGKKANAARGEYWQLYVNGIPTLITDKYSTRNTDYLVWKLIDNN